MNMMTVFVLTAAAMAAFALLDGIVSMAHGGESDDAHATELMFKRTAWQALAVGFVLILAFASAV